MYVCLFFVGAWVGLSVYCTCVSQTLFFFKKKTVKNLQAGHQDSPGEGNLAHFSKGISAGADPFRSRAGDVISKSKASSSHQALTFLLGVLDAVAHPDQA
jgi:hypothetical protein